MNPILRSRILRGVRLFLFSALLAHGAFAADPVTTEGRINRNAFPIARYGSKYTLTPKGVEAELRSRISQVLSPVRLAPASWFRASFGNVPSSSDRRKILESYSETDIWSCSGKNCEGCPGNEALGCVLSKSNAGAVGVVVLIHPCLYGDGKCPRGSPAGVDAWAENIVVGVAYYKAGLKKDTVASQKAQKTSHDWLRNTSRSVNLMLGACPGPYSTESLKFLFGLESVTLPNAAVLRCGQSYIDELRNLPRRCKPLTGSLKEEWMKFEKKQLRSSADILRCDSYCLKMLCRKKDAGTIFTQFSGKPALLLGDGACEGETPKLRGRFFRDVLPREILPNLEEGGCLPALESAPTVNTSDNSVGGLGNGPEVQLVD